MTIFGRCPEGSWNRAHVAVYTFEEVRKYCLLWFIVPATFKPRHHESLVSNGVPAKTLSASRSDGFLSIGMPKRRSIR
jgi:hypothetical protein